MNLKYRSYHKEFLDEDDIPVNDLHRNLAELNIINTWLGGHQVSISGLKKLIGTNKEITICEIGCGGGDNITALNKWLKKAQVKAQFIGIDNKSECIDFAKQKSTVQHVEWITSNYQDVSFQLKPDIIFSSLFCHHFTEDELLFQLNWMKENSIKGFFINDLHRHWLAFISIKWITMIFSKSYLVKHDAPLSVARGFKQEEWKRIFRAAGIKNYYIKWKWAFRYLVVYKHE